MEWFTTTKRVLIIFNHWLRPHNHTCPHQALNVPPRVAEIIEQNPDIKGPKYWGQTSSVVLQNRHSLWYSSFFEFSSQNEWGKVLLSNMRSGDERPKGHFP